MYSSTERPTLITELLQLTAALGGARSVETAVAKTLQAIETMFEGASVALYEYDAPTETVHTRASVGTDHRRDSKPSARTVTALIRGEDARVRSLPGTNGPVRIRAPVGETGVLSVWLTDSDASGDEAGEIVSQVATALAETRARLDTEPTNADTQRIDKSDAAVFKRFHELTTGVTDTESAMEAVLRLGCEYFGADMGAVSCADRTVVIGESSGGAGTASQATAGTASQATAEDASATPIPDRLTDLDAGAVLAVADATDATAEQTNTKIGAYIGTRIPAPRVERGLVWFTHAAPRRPFRPSERELLRLIAQWIGSAFERDERIRQRESFEEAIEEAADGVAVLEDGVYTWIDQTHVDMYGFETKADLLGESWRELYSDEEIERIEAEAFTTLEATGHWSGMVTGSRPDGSTFPAEISLTIIADGRLVCTVRDETERVERERELTLKERAMDEASVGIRITDPTRPSNPTVYVNDGYERVTGYTSEDVIGQESQFVHGDVADPAVRRELQAAIRDQTSESETSESETLESETLESETLESETLESETLEFRDVRADGEPYWARVAVTPLYDDTGALTNYIEIRQDVTDRRQLAETLKARTERLDLVLSGTGTGITEWDLETGTLAVDETIVETFGRSPESIDELFALIQPDDRDRVKESLSTMIETGEPWNGSFKITTSDGETVWVGTRAIPVYEDGSVTTVLATATDVTEQKEQIQWVERLLQYGPLLFVQTRLEDGEPIISNCNDSFAGRLGYPVESVIGKPLASFYHSTSAAKLQSGGYEDALNDELTIVERDLIASNGETVSCLLRAVPRSESGSTVGTDALFVDISARKERERELEAIFNGTFQFTAVLDPDGTTVEVNDVLLEFGGFEREDIVDAPFVDAPLWDDVTADTDRVQSAIDRAAAGEVVRYETDVRDADGIATIDLSAKPLSDDRDEVSHIIVEGRNITAQRRQRQHLMMIQRVMRHNLRNDITKIRGWAGLLADEPDAAARKDKLERVERVLDEWETMATKMSRLRQVLRDQTEHQTVSTARWIIERAASRTEETSSLECAVRVRDDAASSWLLEAVGEALEELLEVIGDRSVPGDDPVEITVSAPDAGWVEIDVRDVNAHLTDIEAAVLETGEETALTHTHGFTVWLARTIIVEAGGEVSATSTPTETCVTLRVPTDQPTNETNR